MPRRTFKIVETHGEFFIYPMPVIKDKKYLIKVNSVAEGQDFLAKIDTGEVEHPDESTEELKFERLHVDGQTKILKF